MRFAVVLLVALACSGALASQPGQPLDCSDWVSDFPGFICEESPVYDALGTNLAIDNQGFKLHLDFADGHFKLVRVDPATGQRQIIGHIESRQGSGNSLDQISATPPCPSTTVSAFTCNDHVVQENVVFFDPVEGTLSIPVISSCGNCPSYGSLQHTLRIHGFATMFDVLQTYTPPPATLGFRVPYMPEGMGGADHFDTYWGDLATVGDWSKAKGLQCGYPATPPHVGDYFSIADTLDTPAPGSGYYYVTATTYQGQTRYGRKTTAGHLSGRDPAVLPACTIP